MIYLASPFTHKDPVVRRNRYLAVLRACQYFAECKIHVFSPIVNSYQVTKGESGDHDYWMNYDLVLMAQCEELWTLKYSGFRESVGITLEKQNARELGIDNHHIVDPKNLRASVDYYFSR